MQASGATLKSEIPVRNGMSKKGGLADPSIIAPYDKEMKQLVNVIVETPQGSRNKYAFDEKKKIFQLKKVLPTGMDFPYDFGFIPSTRADDDDPIDVLLLMDEPAFPGCLVRARLIGAILGMEKQDGKKVRNDRLVAVSEKSLLYGSIGRLGDLGAYFLDQLERFFTNYHSLDGVNFRVLVTCCPSEARALLKRSRKMAKKKAQQ